MLVKKGNEVRRAKDDQHGYTPWMDGETLREPNKSYKTMKIRSLFSCLAMMALFYTGQANADLIIDDFSAGNDLVVTNAGSVSQTTVSALILGNSRFDVLNVAAADTGATGSSADYAFDGIFRVSQDVDVGLTGTLTYDGLNDTDLSQGGANNQLTFDFRSDISVALTDNFTATVTSGANSFTVPVVIPASSGVTNVAFSDFTGVDFSQVDEIQLAMDFTNDIGAGRDIEMNFVSATTAVPEPTSLAILGIASSFMVIRRRRSK